MKFCKNCGMKLADEVKFCPGCGTKSEVTPAPKKFCTNCGAELEGTQFCTRCGVNVGTVPVAALAPKAKKKLSGGKIALICVGAVLLLIALVVGVLALLYCNTPEQTLLRAVAYKNYPQAAELLQENPELAESELLTQALNTRIEAIRTEYMEHTLSLKDAQDELQQIQKLNQKDTWPLCAEVYTFVAAMENSRIYFQGAQNSFDQHDYIGAMEKYAQVHRDDPNYAEAQEKLALSKQNYRQQVLDLAASYGDDLDTAIETLTAALQVLPEDETFLAQIAQYEADKYGKIGADAIHQAEQLMGENKYIDAINLVTKTMMSLPEDAAVLEELEGFHQQLFTFLNEYTLEKAQSLHDEGKLAEAIALLNDTVEFHWDSDLDQLLNAYAKEYETELWRKVNLLLEEKKYEEALRLLNQADRENLYSPRVAIKRRELMEIVGPVW